MSSGLWGLLRMPNFDSRPLPVKFGPFLYKPNVVVRRRSGAGLSTHGVSMLSGQRQKLSQG